MQKFCAEHWGVISFTFTYIQRDSIVSQTVGKFLCCLSVVRVEVESSLTKITDCILQTKTSFTRSSTVTVVRLCMFSLWTVVFAGVLSTVHLAQLQPTCSPPAYDCIYVLSTLEWLFNRMWLWTDICQETLSVRPFHCSAERKRSVCQWSPETRRCLKIVWFLLSPMSCRRQILVCIRFNFSTVSVCLLAVGPNHADPGLMVYKINEWRMIWTGASLL